jgi:hypothetical protein
METKYIGTRTREGCKVEKLQEGKDPEVLDPRLDLWNHSVRRVAAWLIPEELGKGRT